MKQYQDKVGVWLADRTTPILVTLIVISAIGNMVLLDAWLDERGEHSACEALAYARQDLDELAPRHYAAEPPDYRWPSEMAEGRWDGYHVAAFRVELAFIYYGCEFPEREPAEDT